MSISCLFKPMGRGWNELPTGYRELEYIESTGTQWIETEIPAQINVKLQGKIQFPDGYHESYFASLRVSGSTDSRYYLLNMDATASNYVGLVCTKYAWGYAASMNKSDGVASPVEFESYIGDTSCYIKVDSRMYSKDNIKSGVPTSKTIPLFGGKANNSNVVNSFSSKTRLWYARLLVNDVLVRDFIPCLDYSGVPCMYDTISRKTFYNAGKGTFNYKLKPLQFPSGYTELEYIESTGTQWIETEIPAQINVKLQGKIQFPNGYKDSYFASLKASSGDTRYYLLNINSDGGKGFVCTKYAWGYAASMNKSDGVASPVEFESYIGDTSCYIKVDSRMYSKDNIKSGVPTSKTIPLFGGKIDNSDVVNYFSPKTRLWRARLLVNDVLVRDFLPYLDLGGVPCMVDVLTGKPYYNAGTGTFNYKLK